MATTSDIEHNIHILAATAETTDITPHDYGNVMACIADARLCLDRFFAGQDFSNRTKVGAQSWADSAAMWVNRGAQHAFGFALPSDWIVLPAA
jgi:hypothetical protein